MSSRLDEIASQIEEGRTPRATVRELLSWFDAYRRGVWVVQYIRAALRKRNLTTEPDFESAYIDSKIRFVRLQEEGPSPPAPVAAETPPPTATPVPAETPLTVGAAVYADPAHRISKLAAANQPVVSTTPDAPLNQATTLMLANDFSQLPVMTSDREVKGVISWTSIGSRLALGRDGSVVRELMDQHQEIRADASLFAAIAVIAEHGYVLVRASDNRISGVVTSSDLGKQFRQLAEPFLLLEEIENHIRRVIDDKFSKEELAGAKDPADTDRTVASVVDLNFGEYIRLLEEPKRWKQLGLSIDRATFIEKLDHVRSIRNDVMHFDPDGIPDQDLEAMRDFARFLQRLQSLGVT